MKLPLFVISLTAVCASNFAVMTPVWPPSADRFVDRGDTITLSPSGNYSGGSYQWFFGGEGQQGATNRTLKLTDVQSEQSGFYSLSYVKDGVAEQVFATVLKVFGPVPHGFSSIFRDNAGTISMGIAGETHAIFGQYYDLYLIEASADLKTWSPWTTRVQRNAELWRFPASAAAGGERQFFRMLTNQFVTPLPLPTGPYSVGTFSKLLSRTNGTGVSRFMATFWHPASPQAGMRPTPYAEGALARSATVYGGFTSRTPSFFAHSVSNAPPAAAAAKLPVVLYSCGGGGVRRENSAQTEELASWGYLVVGLDHGDTPVSVQPDGRVVVGKSLDVSSFQAARAAIDERVLDAQAALDELERMQQVDERFNGRLDLDRIGAFGWSFGGATVVELARVDSRCKAVAGMDGVFLKTNLLSAPLGKPFLFFRSKGPDPDPAANINGVPADDRRAVFNAQVTDAYWLKLTNMVHWSFAEYPLIWDPVTFQNQFGAPPPLQQISGARGCDILRSYLRSFFNKYLLGSDDNLLHGAGDNYPEVTQFLKK